MVFVFSETAQEVLLALLDWFDEQGAWGLLLYIGMYVALVLLLVPAIVFTLGAGFIFGFWQGMLVVLTAMAISSPVAFLLARYTFGERVGGWLRNHRRLKMLNKGLKDEGWKIVLLSRLVPGFPFKLSNYFFGLTKIPLRGFFFGSMAGILPSTAVNVYVGSVAGRLTDLVDRDPEAWEFVLYGIGLVAAIALMYIIVRMARRAMQRTLG